MLDLKTAVHPCQPETIGTIRWDATGVSIDIHPDASLSTADMQKLLTVACALEQRMTI